MHRVLPLAGTRRDREATGLPWDHPESRSPPVGKRICAGIGQREEMEKLSRYICYSKNSPSTSAIFWRHVAAGNSRGTRSPLCLRRWFGQKDFTCQHARSSPAPRSPRSSHRQPPPPPSTQPRAFASSHGGTTRRTKGAKHAEKGCAG